MRKDMGRSCRGSSKGGMGWLALSSKPKHRDVRNACPGIAQNEKQRRRARAGFPETNTVLSKAGNKEGKLNLGETARSRRVRICFEHGIQKKRRDATSLPHVFSCFQLFQCHVSGTLRAAPQTNLNLATYGEQTTFIQQLMEDKRLSTQPRRGAWGGLGGRAMMGRGGLQGTLLGCALLFVTGCTLLAFSESSWSLSGVPTLSLNMRKPDFPWDHRLLRALASLLQLGRLNGPGGRLDAVLCSSAFFARVCCYWG